LSFHTGASHLVPHTLPLSSTQARRLQTYRLLDAPALMLSTYKVSSP